ncbi:MAG: hypothetical protein AB1758_30590, partial [Candidatus Eremiobacterota bacterium]
GGDMVVMDLSNPTRQPVAVEFVPGMVLDVDLASGIQPVMLEQGWKYTLKPGESLHRILRAYCLDPNRSAPPEGQVVAYHVAPSVSPYEDCVLVLWAGLRLDGDNRFQPVLRPLTHRTVVIQRAIWAVLANQDRMAGRDRLARDLREDAEVQGRTLSEGTVNRLADGIWRDVERTLQEAHK